MHDRHEIDPDLSFAAYLRDHARRTDDPAGDFIEDARDEIRRGKFARGNSWISILTHLHLRGACYQAIDAAEQVYRRRYIRWRKGRP